MRGRAEQVERIANNLEKTSGVSFYFHRQLKKEKHTFIYVTGSEKRYIVAHIFKIELLAPRGRVSSQL